MGLGLDLYSFLFVCNAYAIDEQAQILQKKSTNC